MTKEQKRSYNQSYYAKNRATLIEMERRRRKRPEYIVSERSRYKRRRIKVLAQKKQHHITNRVSRIDYNRKYYIKNRDRMKLMSKQYRKINPGKVNAWNSARRASQFNATTDATACKQFYSWVRNQDFVTCTYCGVFVSGKGIEIDHIVPITRGGAHHPDNFCVSCSSCNSSKNDNLLSEWSKCPEKFKDN